MYVLLFRCSVCNERICQPTCHSATESGVQSIFHPLFSFWPNECGCIYLASIFDTLRLKNPCTDATISSSSFSCCWCCFSLFKAIYCESLRADFIHVKCCLYCTAYTVQMDRVHALHCDNGMTNTYSFLRNVLEFK